MEEPLLDNLQKRLTDLETYIHGPTRKPLMNKPEKKYSAKKEIGS